MPIKSKRSMERDLVSRAATQSAARQVTGEVVGVDLMKMRAIVLVDGATFVCHVNGIPAGSGVELFNLREGHMVVVTLAPDVPGQCRIIRMAE